MSAARQARRAALRQARKGQPDAEVRAMAAMPILVNAIPGILAISAGLGVGARALVLDALLSDMRRVPLDGDKGSPLQMAHVFAHIEPQGHGIFWSPCHVERDAEFERYALHARHEPGCWVCKWDELVPAQRLHCQMNDRVHQYGAALYYALCAMRRGDAGLPAMH